jgi:hypothetical protein
METTWTKRTELAEANERASGDGGIPLQLHVERARPAAPEHDS